MVWSRLASVLALGSAVICASTPALAGRVIIDNTASPLTPCVIGTACTATPIGFNVNLGFGIFGGVYVYSNGLVSIGSQIAAGADLSSLASIGGNVFTAGYSPTMTLSNFLLQDAGNASFDFPGRPVFRVRYLASFDAIVDMPMEFSIFDLGAGAYALQFNHGPAFDDDVVPEIAEDAYLGYAFNGVGVQQQGATLVDNVEAEFDFRYLFNPATAPVPEPASWLMMIAGFALAGGALRGRAKAGLPRLA